MYSFTIPAVVLAAIAAIPAVSAHGYVSSVTVGGKSYPGADPGWIYQSTKPQQAGWFAYNQDNGFVAPSEYGDQNITCHKGATPGTTSITVAAGSSVTLEWNTWPDSHHGPILDYLARCDGDCTKQDKSKLKFFKVDAEGLDDGSVSPGKWATDKMMANDLKWTMKIPSSKLQCRCCSARLCTDLPARPLRQLRPPPRDHRSAQRRPGRRRAELPYVLQPEDHRLRCCTPV